MNARPLLRELLEDVIATKPQFVARVYARLFLEHPELKDLFHRSSPEAQQKMFAQKLMMLVDVLEDPARLRSELASVATSHRSYGITREMYDWVGTALLETVTESLGDRATAAQLESLVGAWKTLTDVVFELSDLSV